MTLQAAGDYATGSNHVLPTMGSARHSSGLSVQTFLRGIHVVDYDSEALAGVAHHVIALANAEDLPGHAAAVEVHDDAAVQEPVEHGGGDQDRGHGGADEQDRKSVV